MAHNNAAGSDGRTLLPKGTSDWEMEPDDPAQQAFDRMFAGDHFWKLHTTIRAHECGLDALCRSVRAQHPHLQESFSTLTIAGLRAISRLPELGLSNRDMFDENDLETIIKHWGSMHGTNFCLGSVFDQANGISAAMLTYLHDLAVNERIVWLHNDANESNGPGMVNHWSGMGPVSSKSNSSHLAATQSPQPHSNKLTAELEESTISDNAETDSQPGDPPDGTPSSSPPGTGPNDTIHDTLTSVSQPPSPSTESTSSRTLGASVATRRSRRHPTPSAKVGAQQNRSLAAAQPHEYRYICPLNQCTSSANSLSDLNRHRSQKHKTTSTFDDKSVTHVPWLDWLAGKSTASVPSATYNKYSYLIAQEGAGTIKPATVQAKPPARERKASSEPLAESPKKVSRKGSERPVQGNTDQQTDLQGKPTQINAPAQPQGSASPPKKRKRKGEVNIAPGLGQSKKPRIVLNVTDRSDVTARPRNKSETPKITTPSARDTHGQSRATSPTAGGSTSTGKDSERAALKPQKAKPLKTSLATIEEEPEEPETPKPGPPSVQFVKQSINTPAPRRSSRSQKDKRNGSRKEGSDDGSSRDDRTKELALGYYMAKWKIRHDDASQTRSAGLRKGKDRETPGGRQAPAFPMGQRKSSYLVSEGKESLAKGKSLLSLCFYPHEVTRANAVAAYDEWDRKWMAKKLAEGNDELGNYVRQLTAQEAADEAAYADGHVDRGPLLRAHAPRPDAATLADWDLIMRPRPGNAPPAGPLDNPDKYQQDVRNPTMFTPEHPAEIARNGTSHEYPDFGATLAQHEREKVPRSLTVTETRDGNVSLRTSEGQLGDGEASEAGSGEDAPLDPIPAPWETWEKTETELREDLRSFFPRQFRTRAHQVIEAKHIKPAKDSKMSRGEREQDDNELLLMSATYIADLLRARDQTQRDHDLELKRLHAQLAYQRKATALARGAAEEDRKLIDEDRAELDKERGTFENGKQLKGQRKEQELFEQGQRTREEKKRAFEEQKRKLEEQLNAPERQEEEADDEQGA